MADKQSGQSAEQQQADQPTLHRGYLGRWRALSRPSRLYLVHIGLTTGSLAIYGLFFNLAILALGYPLEFLGQLNGFSIATAAVLSVPLWSAVWRIGLKRSLIVSAVMQVVSALIVAVWPNTAMLFMSMALTGMAATIFQVSAPPFMMEHSDAATRDHLFSANAAINIGVAGVGSLLAGSLPALFATLLTVGPESATAYRATFALAAVGLALAIVPLLLIRQQRAARTAPPDAATIAATPLSAEPAAPPTEREFWLTRLPGGRALTRRFPQIIVELLHHPLPVLALLVSPLLVSFGAALLFPYLNLFFKDRFVISDSVLGTIFAGLGIAAGLAALGGPALSTRIGKIRAIVLVQLASIPFLLMLGFVPILGIAVAAALLRNALFNMSAPLYDAFAMERTPEAARPIVIGMINGAYTVGYLVAPFISTRVQDRIGFAPLFLTTAAFYATAALANYLLFVRKDTRPAAQPRRVHDSPT